MAIEIVDLATKNGDFQQQTVSLPEGTTIKKKHMIHASLQHLTANAQDFQGRMPRRTLLEPGSDDKLVYFYSANCRYT